MGQAVRQQPYRPQSADQGVSVSLAHAPAQTGASLGSSDSQQASQAESQTAVSPQLENPVGSIDRVEGALILRWETYQPLM